MVIDVLPDWLMQRTISVVGLRIVVSAQINLQEKQVSFRISTTGWLTKASSKSAIAILESMSSRAQQIKLQKEQKAKNCGWTVLEGDLKKHKADPIPQYPAANESLSA